ncbi:pyruvate kinase [Vulcanisaeta moutnovskia 768-28]|uniref:Pyruvate kinase n=1 Tax=Vulcanisaeta moutnovskia (strain 768-28) TaxID=985053 RepID=F0QTY3_VULM7|nr:pyruvate kinase [Vulcanisaeta moutnovskia]ADY01769.1 pyruvate kinase [Vulcanisaeta moutnovskia 768-28]
MVVGKVKIVATIGPTSEKTEVLKELIKYVDGIRINFSHGNTEEWKSRILNARELRSDIAVLGDLRGPGVRTGSMKPLTLNTGDSVEFRLAEEAVGNFVPIPNPSFFRVITIDDIIVMNDGRLRLRVDRVSGNNAVLTALTAGIIAQEKAVVIKGKDYPLPILDDYDREVLKFAVEVGMDYVGVSHVRSSDDIEEVRTELRRLGGDWIKLVAKIEGPDAVRNMKDVVCSSDYVMVARGDLGMHFDLEEIPRIQTAIIKEAQKCGRPVMVATQLLESMIEQPVPTRAEVVDITNAVTEGVDSLLLTGETAVGKYPVEAVQWLRRVASEYEDEVHVERDVMANITDRLALGIVQLAEDIGAKIVIYSRGGRFVEAISRYRPRVPTYVGVSDERIMRRLRLYWGVEPILIGNIREYDEGERETLNQLIRGGLIAKGDLVLLTHGVIDTYNDYSIRILRV